MNLRTINAKRVVSSEDYARELELQAQSVPLLMEFIETLLLDRLKQHEDLSPDDSNWIIKRAMKDGRQAELRLLLTTLVGE